ncbi:MAG: hypothetical protein FGM14_06525 [Flavobacteriales bacterium]|nr:hypothetical protein [Flavobacteriales bacterium]
MKKSYILLLIVTLYSCTTSKDIVKTEIIEIVFGSGGGFTGEINSYKLTANGKIYNKESELKKIKLKKTLTLFNQADKIKNLNFNEPGNMYSFIEIITKDNTNKIVWSLGSSNVDKKVIELHKNLTQTTK